MEEEYLNKLKSVYESVAPTPRLRYYGWKEISDRIGEVRQSGSRFFGRKLAIIFACFIVVFLGGFSFYTSVKASMPGGFLYPVKILSEDVVSKVTDNNQIKVENRADEIVRLVEKKSKDAHALQRVSFEYSNEVNKIFKNVGDSHEERDRLMKHLQEDYKRFDEAVQKHPEAKKDIEDAIKASGEIAHSSGED